MRIFPVPADGTYDYVPIGGEQVRVGTDLLALWAVQGEITHAFPPDDPGAEELWVYFMATVNPDGSATWGIALFPETPSLYPDNWWGRYAIWKRAAKLADGGKLTAGDGSKWIYPAGEDGRMRCYAAGSAFDQGERRFRGELTTDERDLWICDDPEWDWLPVAAGEQVSVGDTVIFLAANHAVVDEVVTTQTPALTTRAFVDNDDQVPLGWWVESIRQAPRLTELNTWSWFERLPAPAAEATFRAPDGSRWIYTGSAYYCWGAGSTYTSGSVFRRGEITGGLKPIVGP